MDGTHHPESGLPDSICGRRFGVMDGKYTSEITLHLDNPLPLWQRYVVM